MIKIPQPAMVWNAENVPDPKYKMWHSWTVASNVDPAHACAWTAVVAKGHPDGKLKALVINCHSSPASLGIGTGISIGQIGAFAQLSGLVTDIYIVGCNVVSFDGTALDGNLFCGAMAKAAGANVYASDSEQNPGVFWLANAIPFGYIDGYEGRVWKWLPDGSNQLTEL